jgi:hypothetical protein
MPITSQRIIWLALTVSQLMLVAVVFMIPHQIGAVTSSDTEATVDVVRRVAPFVGAALLLASVILSKLGGVKLKASRPAIDQDPAHAAVVSGGARAMFLLIVRGALHEAIVVFGFILAFLSRDPMQVLPYFAAGFLSNLCIFPSRNQE